MVLWNILHTTNWILLKGHLLWQNLTLSSKPYVIVFSKIPIDLKNANSITLGNVCQQFDTFCLFHIRKESTRKSKIRQKQINIPPTNPNTYKYFYQYFKKPICETQWVLNIDIEVCHTMNTSFEKSWTEGNLCWIFLLRFTE